MKSTITKESNAIRKMLFTFFCHTWQAQFSLDRTWQILFKVRSSGGKG